MVAMTATMMTWLIASQPATATERAGQTAQIASDSKPGTLTVPNDGPLRPYGTDRMERLDRGRMAETVLVVAVGVGGVA